MDKASKLFLFSSPAQTSPNGAPSETDSRPNLHVKDRRIARLLILLRQINESTGGLAAFPNPQVSEIVSCAVRLCGLGSSTEAKEVVAAVLEALEIQDAIREIP
jgi:hypothetical protein